jgi:putative peptidoglycan lipid II flippase
VFYAREQPWTPILIIIAITVVKIATSLLAPRVASDKETVAGYLGLANGIGFLAGAVLGYLLLHRALKPPRGKLPTLEVIRTILVTTAASLLAGLIAYVIDRLLGLQALTEHAGGVGSLLRLLVLGLIMLPILVAVMLAARVPDAVAAWGAIKRRITRTPPVIATPLAALDRPQVATPVTYPEHSNSSGPGHRPLRYETTADATGKGPEVNDQPSGMLPADSTGDATTRIPRQAAGDFQPDVPDEVQVGTVAPSVPPKPPNADFAGDPTREPLAFDPPREPAMESTATADDDEAHLIPGASIAGGRYRLLVFHGGPPGLQFWQALDTALDRQVALTFVDPDRTMTDAQVQEILSRTLKLSRIERPGIARVLDVANTGTGGLVVSEWIRGGSLKEVADTSPSPIGGARAVQALAAAADTAHGSGVALSIDHPSRVRVSIEGDVALAFPATLPTATPEDDIRGIGAALYALLVDRWPLPEKGVPSGLEPAETDPAGEALEPRAVDGAIPFQISAAAARSVQAGGGIRSAPTLLNLLQQATAVADRTDLIEPVASSGPPSPQPATGADAEAQARKRRNLLIGVGVGAAILVIALIVLASVLSSIFGDVGGGLKGDQLGLNPSTSQSENTPSGSTVKPVKVTVFSPGGGADNPDKADLALSSGPGWTTDTYTDPNPFPNFKNGVGLLLQLPQPTTVGSVSLTVPSTGTQVQIRSASSANPSTLDDTTALTQPTALQPGANTIQVDAKAPTTYLVVWISTMGTTDGKNKTEISGLTVKTAS